MVADDWELHLICLGQAQAYDQGELYMFYFNPKRRKIECWVGLDPKDWFDLPCTISWASPPSFELQFVQDKTELSTGLSPEDPEQK